MTEAQLQDAIRLELGNRLQYPELVLWRNNCGVLTDAQGRHVRFGVANPGGADLIGLFRSFAGPAVFVAAEIKLAKGKQTPEQVTFGQLIEVMGGEYVVLRSVDAAKQWIADLRIKHGGSNG